MSLIDKIREQFSSEPPALAADRSGMPAPHGLQAATVALLLEMAHGDEEFHDSEKKALLTGLHRSFGLSRAQAEELMSQAEWSRPPRRRLAELTQLIASGYDEEQRQEVARLLWAVLDADGRVEEWERIYLSYITDRLDLTRDQVLAARG